MSLLLLFGGSAPVGDGALNITMTLDQAASGYVAAIDFQETLTFAAQGSSFAVGLNSRESIEALETFTVDARNSRESIEVLYNINVDGLNSRESLEALWQNTGVSALDARLSIEILEGPILAKDRWNVIAM